MHPLKAIKSSWQISGKRRSKALDCDGPSAGRGLSCGFGVEPPTESNWRPILTIDARAFISPAQHLMCPHNRAGGSCFEGLGSEAS